MDELLPNISDFIARISPLNTLPAAALHEIARSIRIDYLPVGQLLPFDIAASERFLYIVRTGSLEQRWRDGVLRARLGAEDMFGFTFLEGLPGDPADCYNVIALENTLLYKIPHVILKSILDTHPQYATHFSINARVRLNSAMDVVWHDEEKGMFVRTISELGFGNISVVQGELSIQETARQMRVVERTSMAVVMEGNAIIGIICDKDLTLRVVAEGYDTARPVREVMTLSPLTVSPTDLGMTAVSLMMAHGINSLPVVSGDRPVGLLSASHLVKNHRVQAIFLIERINHCKTVEELAALQFERQAIFEALVDGNLRNVVVEMVMSSLMDAFTRRLIVLALEKWGAAPCDFVWIAAGSHARNEVHIHSDQDSALILSDDAGEEEQRWFSEFAQWVCKGLEACGYSLCSGKYMACESRWCKPLRVWQMSVRKWVKNPEYNQLLNATVFLETRTIYGNASLCHALQNALLSEIAQNSVFLRCLTRDAITTAPPLGIFNNLVLEKSGTGTGTLNIKRYALTLIIDLARIYALACGSAESGTEARFQAAQAKGSLSADSCTDLIDAFRFLSRQRLCHQVMQLKKGEVPDNNIAPRYFGNFERKHLKDAFRIIARQQDIARLRFITG